jgi:hypothetical protein
LMSVPKNKLSMEELPDYLQKYCEILRKVFPNGINDQEIEILVFLMYEHFSRRNLARLISASLNTDYFKVYNMIARAGYNEGEKNLERLEEIRTDLIIHGYENDTYISF